MTAELRQRVLSYLDTHHVMTLATRTPDDLWAAAVFYVNKEFDFFFLSAAHTRHARHIARDDMVAATIQEDYSEWQAIQGIQMEGRVRLMQGKERDAAISLYRLKFRFLQTAPKPIKIALERVNWYRLTPSRLYFVDNSRGFGHRDELSL